MQTTHDNPGKSRLRWGWVLSIAITAIVLANLLPRETPSPSDPLNPLETLPAPKPQLAAQTATMPLLHRDGGYTGSTACADCHEDEHESWKASHHSRMTQWMTPETVLADFNDVEMEFQGERFTMSRKGDQFWTTIEDLQTARQSPGGRDPDPLHLRMGIVTGSHHMQVFWLPGHLGNLQIGFPFSWLVKDKRWAPRNSLFIRDPHMVISKENWNMTCIRCHTTAGQPRPNQSEQSFETRVAELGISCEACHGPGQEHVDRQQKLARSPQSNLPEQQKLAIIQPADLRHPRASQVCGHCHGMKWFDKSENWTHNGFRFHPGDDLEATTPIIRPTQLDRQPWLKRVLEDNPGILRDFFWTDGVIRVTGREYNGLVESACFQRGKMSCLSCHSMHRSDPNDQLAREMDGDRACLQCHETMADDIVAHTRHPAASSGSRCYNCHMPHTSYGLLQAIRGHHIEIPNVNTTLETGRPNACNLCHLDKTLSWTSEQLVKWKPQPETSLPREHRETAAALVWLLKGDAGQRALAAWHMGWEPALRTSGHSWQTPFLTELLNDPYSAVRYVAHKALQKHPGFADFDYDFVSPEDERKSSISRAKTIWKSQEVPLSKGSTVVLLKPSGGVETEAMERLVAERDNRPIRLRE